MHTFELHPTILDSVAMDAALALGGQFAPTGLDPRWAVVRLTLPAPEVCRNRAKLPTELPFIRRSGRRCAGQVQRHQRSGWRLTHLPVRTSRNRARLFWIATVAPPNSEAAALGW